jgi:hypothetical protein
MPLFDQERLPVAPAVLPAAVIRTFVDVLFDPIVRNRMQDVIRFVLAWKQVRSLTAAGSIERQFAAGFSQAAGGGIPGLMNNIETSIDALRLSSNIAWLVTPAELERIIGAWSAAWGGGLAPAVNVCPASDVTFLRYLRTYIRNHNMSMWIPRTEFDGYHQEKVKLRLSRYDRVALVDALANDQMNGVNRFLKLFAAGAHIVIVHSDVDTRNANIPSFYNSVMAGGLATRTARMNSHYTGNYISNFNAGMYYPDYITTEAAPVANCPFIASTLICRTASGRVRENQHNTFIQLEGWPATGYTGAGGRHGADYKAHTATKWNISTYGASLYSEKRGTTLFLAPPAWTPVVRRGTGIMASYYGAHARQSWLDMDLIR